MLKKYERDDLELVIDVETGEVFANQNAISRMTDRAKSTISDWGKGVRSENVIEVRVETASGIQGVRLYNEEAIYEAFAKYKPQLLIQCAKAGIRLYLHGLAGYRYQAVSATERVEVAPTLPKRDSIEYANTAIELNRSDLPAALKQLILDRMGDELSTGLIPNDERWIGAAQKAEEMGFKIDHSNRTKLGRFVAAQGLPVKKEKRLCNGQSRDINTYLDCEELEGAISNYFER